MLDIKYVLSRLIIYPTFHFLVYTHSDTAQVPFLYNVLAVTTLPKIMKSNRTITKSAVFEYGDLSGNIRTHFI